MMVKDVFSRMNNILHNYNKTHKFSGENNHVFLVTPYTALCIREYYESGTLGHVLEPLRYKGYRIWKLKGNNDRLILFADVHQAMNTGGMFDESPMWKYFKEKEVRKRMAIDYKKEWEKLDAKHGDIHMQAKEGSPKSTQTLGNIMKTQIRNAILDRDRLMNEYIHRKMETNIDGGTKLAHNVDIIINNFRVAHVPINKKLFDEWCKSKNSNNECMRKFGTETAPYWNMDTICKVCGERLGKHMGTECPKKGGK